MAQQLTVYIRQGCHLRPELGFDITAVDIDADPELVRLYNTRVPVLVAGDTEICYYFLEEERLRAYLRPPA